MSNHAEPLNEELVPGNACFGCGLSNPSGLGIRIFEDPQEERSLIGQFTPSNHMEGFPGIIHGGIVFSALDCMAIWTGMALKPEPRAMWVLRSAQVTYHRPARAASPVALHSRIEEDGAQGRSILVAARAEDEEGNVLVSGRFKVVALTEEQLEAVVGGQPMAGPWASFLKP